jgi:hypothetical protein
MEEPILKEPGTVQPRARMLHLRAIMLHHHHHHFCLR